MAGRHRRLGLLGDWKDPVAQLLEDLPEERDTDFVHLIDPDAAADLDEILVLSQADALAHLPGLIASGLPCRIVVRRRGPAGDEPAWQASANWLTECLKQTDWASYELVALTESAAEDLAAMFGLPVTVLGHLPKIETDRPTVAVDGAEDVITFTMAQKDGGRETRRANVSSYSWVRLRRLARLIAADVDDMAMNDLVAFATGTLPAATPPDTPSRRCILAVVPNGVGLGHVTRMMAIAKALNTAQNVRVVFWSFSRAAEILQAAGFEVILRQNAFHLKAHPPSWRQWETLEFAQMIRHLKANVVVYDGSSFDSFLTESLSMPGCGRCGVMWVRRGMLRPESDAQLLEAEQYCDLVLEPGDLAVEMDKGPTRTRIAEFRGFSRHVETRPITLKPYLPSYTRKEAKRKLGLGWGRQVLVSLGGEFGDWDHLKDLITRFARQNRIGVIWAQSPLAPPLGDSNRDTKVRRFYPLSRYIEAFDGMITATGYNSYHELMLGYKGPVLLAPTNNVRIDDQVARATFASTQGWAQCVFADRLHDQAEIISDFMAQVRRGAKITERPSVEHDADEIAREVFAVCDRYS